MRLHVDNNSNISSRWFEELIRNDNCMKCHAASTTSNFSQGQWAWLHHWTLNDNGSQVKLPFVSTQATFCKQWIQSMPPIFSHIPDWLLITAVNRLGRLAKKTTCMCPQWFMVRIYGKRYSTLTHHIFPNREKAHIQICIGFATHKSKTLSLIQYLIP